MPTASRQKASRLLCCSSSFISACAVLSPTAASITGPTLNADPIAGSRRPIIVPMQQSRKSSICSPPLDAGLPLLESFSQTSAGLESIHDAMNGVRPLRQRLRAPLRIIGKVEDAVGDRVSHDELLFHAISDSKTSRL